MPKRQLTRTEAIDELAKYGITGNAIYLIGAIPLIEMMWADGRLQPAELLLLDEFLAKRVSNLNQLAGTKTFTLEEAKAFANRFLQTRPSEEVLRVLSSMVSVVGLNTGSLALSLRNRDTILNWCLDIAAASVTEYPYGDHDRFNSAEKACFTELVHALGVGTQGR